MEGVRNAFIGLLRSGLWGRNPVAEGFQRLSDEQWNMVFRLSGRQTVTGIVFDGICRLPEDLQPSPAIFAPWVVAVDRIERSNERMNDVLKSLVKLFADNGLNPVLQKGQGVAALYPEPLHRECGDIDFYFPEGLSPRQAQRPDNVAQRQNNVAQRPDNVAQRQNNVAQRPDNVAQRPSAESAEASEMTENGKAAELVKSRGAKVETMPDGSQNYEWEGIEIEQHPTIVDLCSPRTRKWLGELDDDPGFIPSTLADGLLVPSPELNALLLNSHILKHTLGKGIGLRQMCDLAMEYHRICKDGRRTECGERIFNLYKRAGILKWSRLLHSFLVGVIGLPEDELPYSERIVSAEPLMRIVEEGGNFGQYRGEDSGHSGTSTSSATGRLSDRKRKLKTAGMFLRRAGFSMRFAPKEAFWTFWELVKGQFRK